MIELSPVPIEMTGAALVEVSRSPTASNRVGSLRGSQGWSNAGIPNHLTGENYC